MIIIPVDIDEMMRVLYTVFTYLKWTWLSRIGSARKHRNRKGPDIIFLVVLVIILHVECVMGLVQGARRYRASSSGYRSSGGASSSGYRPSGGVPLVIHGKAQGSQVTYSIVSNDRKHNANSKGFQDMRVVPHPAVASLLDRQSSGIENLSEDMPDEQQIRWANAAFEFVGTLDCSKAYFTTERECRNLKKQSKSHMTVHIANPSAYGRLATLLPDGGLAKTGLHDAVIVLDPYPAANYGHLVLVFYIDLHASTTWCHRHGGIFLGEYNLITLIAKLKNIGMFRRKLIVQALYVWQSTGGK